MRLDKGSYMVALLLRHTQLSPAKYELIDTALLMGYLFHVWPLFESFPPFALTCTSQG